MKKKEAKQDKTKRGENESGLVTKESICAVCALFSLLALLVLFTRASVFGDFGVMIHSLLTGVFGYAAYPVMLAALYVSAMGLVGKRLIKNRKAATFISLTLVSVVLIVHTALTWSFTENYLSECFSAGERFPAATPAGWLGGLLVFALSSVTSKVGAIVIFSILAVFFAYISVVALKRKPSSPSQKAESEQTAEVTPVEIPLSSVPTQGQAPAPQPVAQPQAVFTPRPQPVEGAPQRPEYGYMEADVPQRPMVSVSDDRESNKEPQRKQNNAFSPFGAQRTEAETQPTQRDLYENSRAVLFTDTPQENYKRNLIFDPNSNVNKRAWGGNAQTPVTSEEYPSYADEYQTSINDGANERPAKIFTDYSTPNYDYGKINEPAQPVDPITPLAPIEETPIVPQKDAYTPVEDIRPSYTESFERAPREEEKNDTDYRRHDYMDLFSPSNPNVFGSDRDERKLADETFSRGERADEYGEPISRGGEDEFTSLRDESRTSFERSDRDFDDEPVRGGDRRDIFDEPEEKEEDPYTLRSSFEEPRTEASRDRFESTDRFESRGREELFEQPPEMLDRGRDRIEEEEKPAPKAAPAPQPAPPPPPKPRVIRPYVKVPLDDFDCRDVEPTANQEEVEETKENILATLNDYKINDATIASVTFGPTVTRYNVAIPRNIPPKKVVALDQPIAISLHSNGVNIYPNYEDGVVSIEVPNKERQFVQLGCMLSGDSFVNSKPSSLMFAMGKDVGNRKVYGDISKMIHLLVAGASGSGKSVFLGSLIISLIYKYSPEELRLILIDPKKTEFVLYSNLPHLMINEIITDANKAVQSLNWAIGEMNRRYELFKQMSLSGKYVVNLDDYNAQLKKEERLPKIVIIIDELADLMLAAKKDIEDRIQNLTQKARAAGIHLIVATQRPSTDVITGVIKSNLPTRIAFGVATEVDSRVILDQSGAHKLLGKGDFLYTMQGINAPVRVQSAFISNDDSQRVVNFIKSHNEAYYDEDATSFINNTRGADGGSPSTGDEVEAVYIDALRYVIMSGSASISMIQRKCSVGYNKAGKIVEWMEDMGYISSFDGAKARKVLITQEEFESKYGPM